MLGERERGEKREREGKQREVWSITEERERRRNEEEKERRKLLDRSNS